MKLIVGLGNPGPEYERTRHNVGYVVLDRLARRFAPGEVARGRFHGVTIETLIDGEKILLLKPMTYMNLSGQAVGEAARFYKIEPDDILVIVDDVALACGLIRMRASGGAGGHNGLTDVEQKLASNAYARLRIGVDAPGQIPRKNYVLGRFTEEQRELIEPALEEAVDASVTWVSEGALETMNRFNKKQAPLTTNQEPEQ